MAARIRMLLRPSSASAAWVLLTAGCVGAGASSSTSAGSGFGASAGTSAGTAGAAASGGAGASTLGGVGGSSQGGSLSGGSTAVAGVSSVGGASGSGGAVASAGQAGAAGVAGAAQDPRLAAEVLDGFALLKPCVSGFKPSGNANNSGDCCCEELAQNENQHISKQFGGDAQLTYQVKLRIAGVAERYWYAGGQLDATSKLFYAGGLPTIHSDQAPNSGLNPGQGACKIHPPQTDGQFALPFLVPNEIRPADGCYNGFNIFAMTVSSPQGKQSYYLNYTTDFDGSDRQPHSVYKNDYTVTIAIPGQAQLDFYTIDGDHHQVTNNGTMTLPNLKTPQPYNGNFLEFTLLDVTAGN